MDRTTRYIRLRQFLPKCIAANTSNTTAPNHRMNESHPVVIIAPATKRRASAASRRAVVSGHRGALGVVIASSSSKGEPAGCSVTTSGCTGPVLRRQLCLQPATRCLRTSYDGDETSNVYDPTRVPV